MIDHVTSDSSESIRVIFLRRLVRSWMTAAVVCAGITVAVCYHVRGAREKQFALRQVELVAAALTPGAGGDLFDSVSRMRSRCGQLLAVGTVGVTGDLVSIYPDRLPHRKALSKVVAKLSPSVGGRGQSRKTVTTTMASPDGGGLVRVTAALASLAGEDDMAAQRVVVLLRTPEPMTVGYVAVMLLGPIALVSVLAFASVYQWFGSSVTRPLRRLGAAMEEPPTADGRRRRLQIDTCRELAGIAQRYDDLLRIYRETHMQHEQFQLDAHERLVDRQAGLDRQLRRAEDKAMTDPITRLRNRAFLETHLDTLFEQHERSGSDLSAVMFDLDFFKQHNDRYGHQSGDELLAFAASLMAGSTRAEDVSVRYGGDEFLMVLPGVDPDQAARIADRIVKMFAQHSRQFGLEPVVSLSAGVASLRRDAATSSHDLIDKADRALYKTKRRGKNGVAAFSAA